MGGGIAAGLNVIEAMLIGMLARIYFMDHVSSAVWTTFIISMAKHPSVAISRRS